MLYTKYESSGPCSFGQEDFWKLQCESVNNFDRRPPRDHSCEVWSKSIKWFQRRCCLKKLLTDGRTHGRTDGRRTTDAGHWRITKAHLSTSCSGELKSAKQYVVQTTQNVSKRMNKHIRGTVKKFPDCLRNVFFPTFLFIIFIQHASLSYKLPC